MIESKKRIILDADVIIHFFRGGCLKLLPKIFKNDVIICDILLQFEIFPGPLNDILKELIDNGDITVVELELHEFYLEILIEYGKLKKQFGKGESACMAFCKYSNDVIGSSNLKDILEYYKKNSIGFITTMGFLKEAFDKKLFTEDECNKFVKDNLDAGSRLPYKSFSIYLSKGKQF